MAKNKKAQPVEAAELEAKEEAVEIVETEATEEATPEAKEEAEPKMYVGPTIREVGIIQNQVYTGIPDGAATLIKKCPEFGNLFVDISEYPNANRMLREQNGYVYSAFMKALKLKNK